MKDPFQLQQIHDSAHRFLSRPLFGGFERNVSDAAASAPPLCYAYIPPGARNREASMRSLCFEQNEKGWNLFDRFIPILQMEKERKELLQWKEEERKERHNCQSPPQKEMLQAVVKQLHDMRENFNKLKEDFVYNLRILEERDKELESYDVTFTHLKTSENAKQAEISDLKIQLDKLEQLLVKERRKRAELHYHYQQNLEEHKLELEQICRSKSSHTSHKHEKRVSPKHHMGRKLQELQGEPACQKQVELLTRELEALRGTGMQASESPQTAEVVNLQLEKEDKQEEPSRADKEKDAVSASLEEAPIRQFRKLKKQIRELQMRQKGLEARLRRKEGNHSACVREKDALIEKYKQQLSMAAEQGWLLEQSKTQADLDRQLCGNAENHQHQKSEDLTPSLSLPRKQAEADLQKADYSPHAMQTVPSAFSVEGEELIQSPLSNRGVLPEGEKQTFQSDNKSCLRKDIPSSEIQKLQEQNANLRAVIAQMRKEMESLDEQTPSSLPRREQTAPGHTAEISLLTAGALVGRAEGSLCADQVSGRTTSSNVNVSSANLGCVVGPGTEKGSDNRVMEIKMIDFGSASDNCCPGGAVHCGVSCTPQGTQNKREEAARTTSALSQEKQQLIEMGNRLRTDLGMILKEGLWHPMSPTRCSVCVGSGGLSPRELVKRTQCQLSALRHLQHKLLTQVQLDSSAGNYGPKQQKAATSSKVQSQPPKESPGQAQQVWISSSRAHSSCQGIWQTSEMESSSSSLSPQNNTKQALKFEITPSTEQPGECQEHSNATGRPGTPAAHLAIRGTKLEAQQKLKSRNSPCTYPIRRKISPNRAKIRNYNIKD
ncbi:coiled-coil domain-containing protein 57 isoform X2 [Numida meleagris]|uniref:coiled-coil domain-containing protein 57 isoform X2 n=1 Tax=Numida meleagris TaxID=8996 RepID=UPI000B3E1FC0|nr:coiled-coil domain-containing protein 57 isoform X2 [Numida meleagris]